MSRRVVCRLRDLADSASRGFNDVGGGHGIFLVRKGEQVFGYRNRCPHTGAPMEWKPDQFLDFDGSFIQCALHGALFRIRDGYCVRGPCAGQGLEAVPLLIEDGQVILLDG